MNPLFKTFLTFFLVGTGVPVMAQPVSNAISGENGVVQVFPAIRPVRWMPPTDVVNRTPVRVEQVDVDVAVQGQRAVTTMEIVLVNSNARLQEAEVLLPVPDGAIFRQFDLDGVEGKLPGRLLPRDEARRIYDSIVRRIEDPGLLEFAGDGLLRSSVFPVPANGKATVKVIYEQWLVRDGNRIDYVLPRSEALEYDIVWRFAMQWDAGIAAFSPSHDLEIGAEKDGRVTLAARGKLQPGPIRVSALVPETEGMSSGVYLYPEQQGEDGYFLLVFQAPPRPEKASAPKEITFVFDRSGSMAGKKMDQTRAAALQVLETLNPGDRFNLISYNEAVRSLYPEPVSVDADRLAEAREFIQGTRVSGGTNIHAALMEALKAPGSEDRFSAVLFLTDGIPTVGETRERAILDMLGTANPGKRRVFTFGVGVDLNAPLLASIARTTGGREDFVLPGADVEVPVASLARRLEGVVAVNPKLVFADPQRVDEVLPSQLPDWFAGDQILVLGRYRGTSALMLSLEAGVSTGPERKLATTLQIDPSSATTANGFVPRLWASRRIASLTESLRALGADSEELPSDSRTRELIDEIVRLSLAHGILSEYTAFLADESAPSPQSSAATSGVRARMEKRLIQTRSGAAAVNQELNAKAQREAPFTAKDNRRLDAALAQVAESKVQQIADKTFQLRGDVWQDADAPADGQTKDVEIGTPEFDDLVDQLVSSNRQSILGLPGEVLISQSGQLYRIRSSKASTPHTNP